MKRKRSKHKTFGNNRYFSRVISAGVAAAILLLSGIVTLNEQWQLPFIPTWDELFVMSGFREDITLPDSQLRVTVRDVGNADCILLQNGDKFALIDAGENDDGDELVSFFNRVGITYLDYVIATHPDGDHIGGMDEVVENIEIGTFMMSYMPEGYTPTTRVYENLLTALLEKDITPVEPQHGDSFEFGDARIHILSGLSDYKETNEQSIVCKIVFGKNRFLMMGDAGEAVEEELLSAGVDLGADVLKVGHHGSRYSSSEEFIRAVSPDYALITCGLGNSYNHPHTETINVLEMVDSDIYRCDLNGEIILVSDGETITVTSEK